jgi:hypothetical protein
MQRSRSKAYRSFATETLRSAGDTATLSEPNWSQRLDDLVRGACSEDDFMDEVSAYSEVVPDSAWNVVALLDQQYRRGQVPEDLFKSMGSRIARRELQGRTARPATDGMRAHGRPAFTVPGFQTQNVDRSAALTPAGVGVQPIWRVPDPMPAAANAPTHPVDGLPMDALPVADLEPGHVLRNRYVIESRLDSGGMGTVYKAVDRIRAEHSEVNGHVAIKILHDSARRRPSAVAKLRREFYCAQALSHRSIIKVFELDRDGALDFFSMELLDGKPLSMLMEECAPNPIPRERAWAVIREMAAGISHAHSRHVVHADLKPQNVMLLGSKDLRILDFGASSGLVRHSLQMDGAASTKPTALTPAYASAELLDGLQADPRDDLFALSCLAYELLVGRHPFDYLRATEARKFEMQAVRPVGLTNRQWRALEKGFAWQRADRFGGVREWMSELLPRTPLMAFVPRVREALDARLSEERAGPRVVAGLAVLVTGLAVVALANRPQYVRHAPGELKTTAVRPAAHGEAPSAPAAAAPVRTETSAVLAAAGSSSPTPTPTPTAALRVSPDGGAATVMSPSMAKPAGAAPPPAAVKAKPVVLDAKAAPKPALRSAAPAVKGEKLGMTEAAYKVAAGAKFVEVHVTRAAATAQSQSFTWWTQPGTAAAGTDFVPQARSVMTFAPNKLTATVYVKLFPDATRKRPVAFNVLVGPPGAATSAIARSSVTLPPTR